MNTYAYVDARPTNLIDPWGLVAHGVLLNPIYNDPNLYKWANSYQPNNYNTIIVHGGVDGNFYPYMGIAPQYKPDYVANYLKGLPGYDPTLPTLLIACQGATNMGTKKFAIALGGQVFASSEDLTYPRSMLPWQSGQPVLGGDPVAITHTPSGNTFHPVVWIPVER